MEGKTLLELQQKILLKKLYKSSLYEFVKAFWSEADPDKYVDGALVQFYCECFQYFCRSWVKYEEKEIIIPKEYGERNIVDVREGKRNLNLNVPPRHTKSMIFNVLGPVWLLTNAPVKCASISHNFDLSKTANRKRQRILSSDKWKYYFGDEFTFTSSREDTIVDSRGGELYSKNRDAMTGFGADIIINDDLTNAEDARKDMKEMNNAWSYYQNTMPSRINNISTGVIFNIQQRLAPNDITGHIKKEPNLRKTYSFITLPAVFEKNTLVVCPISGTLIVYKKGDTLWPERFGDYKALRDQVGDTIFESQYLQKPMASDKAIVRENMINEKSEREVPSIEQADIVYASHDFPVKDKETSDFLGSVLAYRVGGMLYIKDCLEERMAYNKSIEYVQALEDNYPGIIQIMEDKANGSAILQQLLEVVPAIKAFQPGTKSKTQRLESATLYMGNVVFVKSQFDEITATYSLSERLQHLKERLLAFPFVDHDDVVDAFSQLILFTFLDRRYMVYGKSFTDKNIVDMRSFELNGKEYSTVFINKDKDLWKVCEIAIIYGEQSKLIVKKEKKFKGNTNIAIEELKKFAPDKNVFIDCSLDEALYGLNGEGFAIERYEDQDFAKSVERLNYQFSQGNILLYKSCKQMKIDIESFKYSKSKTEEMEFASIEDGFVACLRIALKYYGL